MLYEKYAKLQNAADSIAQQIASRIYDELTKLNITGVSASSLRGRVTTSDNQFRYECPIGTYTYLPKEDDVIYDGSLRKAKNIMGTCHVVCKAFRGDYDA